MVTLRIWYPNTTNHITGKDWSMPNIGHASLQIGETGAKDYRYISVWPDGPLGLMYKGNAYTAEDDKLNEGSNPDYVEVYYKMNETEMIAYWDIYKGKRYNLVWMNCMGNVALHLAIGVYGLGNEFPCRQKAYSVNNHLFLRMYGARLKSLGY